MSETTKRLYHFTPAKWALKAIRDKRLKSSELDSTNDLFESLPYREDSQDSFQHYSIRRTALNWRMLCLSKTWKNPLLWGHYADKGKGMCLGFDVIVDHGGLIPEVIKVDYQPNRIEMGYEHPQLKGNESLLTPGLNYGLVKHRDWEYEEEWRTWRNIEGELPDPFTGLYYFPFEGRMTLREILIGPRCEEDNIRCRLEKLTADYNPKSDIVSMRLSNSHFSIERQP